MERALFIVHRSFYDLCRQYSTEQDINFSVSPLQTYRESADVHGWTDLYQTPAYHPFRDEMLVIAPILDGNNGAFRNVMRVRFGSSNIQNPVVQGRFDVEAVHGWSSDGKFM